jgi:DNA-binding LacI/PurR family transcriptional regulator
VLRSELGLTVPEDIQVVGHDDIEAGRFQSYRLTTVRQDMRAMFAKAIKLAFDRRENLHRADISITIENALIERSSTRRCLQSNSNPPPQGQ